MAWLRAGDGPPAGRRCWRRRSPGWANGGGPGAGCVCWHAWRGRCAIRRLTRASELAEREAVALARRLGDADTLGYALVSLTTATWSPDIEELVPYVDEIKTLADETGDLERMFQWGWLRHIICMNLGDIASAEETAVAHRALAWELKQRSQEWYSTVMRSLFPLIRGEFAEAEQLAEEALQIGRKAQSWDAAFSHCILLFAVRREQGRLEEVDQLIRPPSTSTPGTARSAVWFL